MKYVGPAYRAHDPKLSYAPSSGAGAALRGGRFNPKGVNALYLACEVNTAVREASQGLAFKFDPYVICAYDVDCEDIVDLSGPAALELAGATPADLDCGWLTMALAGREPPSWTLARRLIASGAAGVLVPSFAPGATSSDKNLVLWQWSDEQPHRCQVHDPHGKLPKNQSSWPDA